jgi:hypothetical protein
MLSNDASHSCAINSQASERMLLVVHASGDECFWWCMHRIRVLPISRSVRVSGCSNLYLSHTSTRDLFFLRIFARQPSFADRILPSLPALCLPSFDPLPTFFRPFAYLHLHISLRTALRVPSAHPHSRTTFANQCMPCPPRISMLVPSQSAS